MNQYWPIRGWKLLSGTTHPPFISQGRNDLDLIN